MIPDFVQVAVQISEVYESIQRSDLEEKIHETRVFQNLTDAQILMHRNKWFTKETEKRVRKITKRLCYHSFRIE